MRDYQKKGVRINCPTHISPDGYAKITFCHDPDGTSIELVEVLDQRENIEKTLRENL